MYPDARWLLEDARQLHPKAHVLGCWECDQMPAVADERRQFGQRDIKTATSDKGNAPT